MRKILFATVAVSGALLAVTASLAASDYYLKIEGVDGEAANSRARHIEVASWSFGASQATGKRQHKPMTITKPIEPSTPLLRESPTPATTGPAPDAAVTSEVQTVSFSVPEPGDASSAELVRLCASGKPIRNATLGSPNGRYRMTDALITSCAVTGNERRYEFRGHVTLMK